MSIHKNAPIYIYYDYCNLGGVTSIFKQRIALLRQSGIKNKFIFHFQQDLGGKDDLEALPHVKVILNPAADFHDWCKSIIEQHPEGCHILVDQPEVLNILPETCQNITYEVHTSLEQAFKRMRGVNFHAVSNVLCPSQWSKNKLQEVLTDFDENRILVCPNFIDDRRFVPLPFQKEKDALPIILWVGKLNADKNIVDALDIMKRVGQEINFRPVFVTGGATDKDSISKLLWRFLSLDLGEKARWISNLSNNQMPQLLAEVRASGGVCLSTSKFESFGLAALEAMSCGVPVVAAAVGGLQEIVRDTIDGHLFMLGDNKTAALNIVNILKDPQMYANMSENAIASCQRYNPQTLSASYIDIILGKSGRP